MADARLKPGMEVNLLYKNGKRLRLVFNHIAHMHGGDRMVMTEPKSNAEFHLPVADWQVASYDENNDLGPHRPNYVMLPYRWREGIITFAPAVTLSVVATAAA